jgi:pyruvate/2-oxoglutarate/acetoin dehydrogenase E1 component/TPP-dependent pyruvate/acetoin dehydrogenase alpha subunit
MGNISTVNKTLRAKKNKKKDRQFQTNIVLNDFYIAILSRQLSILGRKEVLSGKAKFGIFGDGKEIAQIALAKNFRDGDWRSGYYRDQTFMLYLGLLSPTGFFAQLYGDTNPENNPDSGGRNFNNHFSTANYTPQGTLRNLMKQKNSSADISPTAGQMPRLLGLAYASRLFRSIKNLGDIKHLSDKGNEVAFGTIGDASTSEGHFFETINAAGVLQVPLALAVWDDGYGISVPIQYQTTKQSISEAMSGFEKNNNNNGIIIYRVPGWDYPKLCATFREGIEHCRNEHIPILFHVQELTQPLGHSTSGSHERYKTNERLQWEQNYDPIIKMRQWILENHLAEANVIEELENKAIVEAQKARDIAWEQFTIPLKIQREELVRIIESKTCTCNNHNHKKISLLLNELKKITFPIQKDSISAAKKMIRLVCSHCKSEHNLHQKLSAWIKENTTIGSQKYRTSLYNETLRSALNVPEIKPIYSESSPLVNGGEIICNNFEKLFEQYPLLVAIGEDIGKMGSVNQTYKDLQNKFGALRITDTGIREASIIGQGIGLALRGFRPIAEIQYFDYLLYALQTLSDDLATTHWRTCGRQVAPLIVSTRGHRLEGIWHSGSPMAMLISAIRGIYVCVPRNMTQAAGMYNTLLKADDPGIVIEPLNGYRLKELMPDNIGDYCQPLGVPEILTQGNDITLVTYGSCVKIAYEAVEQLKDFDIGVELIDVQTLLPFDLHHIIVQSVKKTNRVVFFDEDVPGGATAYMMHKVLEEQNAFIYLDSPPQTITAKEHRPAYTTDGDYFSNPNAENVFENLYSLMHETDPAKWPELY